jgi:hypothetical protein
VTPGLIGSGSGSVGFAGSISGPSNLRKGPRNLRIDHIEPEPLEVSGEAFTDSMGVSVGGRGVLGFGNEILRGGGWKLALLCNRRVSFWGGDGAGGGFDEAGGAA